MKFNPDLLKKVDWKKVVGIAAAGISAVAAFSNSISEQQRNKEFEDLKKRLADLENH